jgi:hypothetical protein
MVHGCTSKVLLPAAGCSVEAAIGQLTRLTRLDLSVHRQRSDMVPADGPCTLPHGPQLSCGAAGSAYAPLQLQLLGCNGAASAVDGEGGAPGCYSGAGSSRPAGQRNTGLQELHLHCTKWLTDDELAAAAAALPDLRRLSVTAGIGNSACVLHGLSGAALAAFSACRRLRDVTLPYRFECADLNARQVVAQLAHLTSLTSIKFARTARVHSNTEMELKAAFRAKPRMAAICKWT